MKKELFLNAIQENENIINQLLEIDNDATNSLITYEEFYDNCEQVFNKKSHHFNTNDKNILFITEGNPYLTLEILKNIDNVNVNYVLFVNHNFIGLNKWLINTYLNLSENKINFQLDSSYNYNNYFDKNYKVLPLGEKALIEQVLEDFK